MNQSSMGWTALSLLECVLTLYPSNPDGTPDLGSPVWSGVPAQNLRVADRWLKVETKPTGASFPKKHPLIPQFEISIERVWAFFADNLAGIVPDEKNYVLDIVWTDEDSGNWHRETYYGLTINDRNRASRNEEGGFSEELSFDAQYYYRDGGVGSLPAILSTLPMQVFYLDESGVSVPLYNYNPANGTFTETQAGNAASRATLTYTSDSHGARGTFQIIFAFQGFPVFWLDAAGSTRTFNLVAGSPARSALPRLEFYFGAARVASLDARGTLYSGQFLGNPPSSPGIAFQFFSNNALQFSLDGLAARANAWHLFNPAELSGLKCWTRVENLADLDDGQTLLSWPDESGNQNDLACATIYGSGISYRTGDAYRPSPPASSRIPATDLVTHETLAVSGPAVLLSPGNSLITLADVFNPAAHSIFLVACPFGLNASGRLLNGGTFGEAANDFSLELAAGKIQANFWVQTPALTKETAVGNSSLRPGWYLFEQSGSATNLTATVNGVPAASVAFTSTPAAIQRLIQVGCGDTGFGGYVKAVLVYEGGLTDEEKFWLRLFLNNAYQLY